MQNRKYSINVTVEGKDISFEVKVERGLTPYLIEIQQALLMICLKIGSHLDEE